MAIQTIAGPAALNGNTSKNFSLDTSSPVYLVKRNNDKGYGEAILKSINQEIRIHNRDSA
jgi:hypothetical protein